MAVVSCKVQAPVWDILLVSNLTSGLHICSANVSVDDIMNVSWSDIVTYLCYIDDEIFFSILWTLMVATSANTERSRGWKFGCKELTRLFF